ncbi:Ankyrin-2 [Araneus ventricosus]|uniref:Alpha-latrotoxin n=1 Tax=Araneus ventricosus TaxID=182803 RepID=A0A4Y2L946_ARAVE|nr:Ankyrin-2 [Araneus ventricosus]
MSDEIHQAIAAIGEERNGEKALQILYLSAYFAPAKNIHLDMFSDILAKNEEAGAAIELLKQKSLVESFSKDTAFVMKKTIQKVIRTFLKRIGKEKEILIIAIPLVMYRLIENEIHPNYVDHALSLLTYICEFHELVELSAELPSLVVSTLRKQNRLEEAFAFAKSALDFLEKALGEGHSATLSMQHTLTTVLETEGKHVKAEKASKELHEKDFKYSTKEEMVQSLIMHARELCELSKYEEALPLYQKLIGDRTVLETLESGVLTAWNDYATLLNDMGRHSEAASILQDVIIQKRIVWTPDDQYGVVSRRNLAIAFLAQENYNKALKHLNEAMFEGKERLGKLHPDTLRAERDIGLVLLRKGDYDEALKTLGIVEKKFKQVLRENHPDILCTQANIITALINLGKYDKALEISQYVYEAYRNSLGEKQNETLQVKNNIGSIFLRQGKLNEAIKIFREVYRGFCDVFGPEHYKTIEVRTTLDALGHFSQTTGIESETLHVAVQEGDLNKVVELIENNADVNEKDFEGRRPLHYATFNGHIDIVKYLLKKGAMHDAKNLRGETPLALASGSRMKNLLISVGNLFKAVKEGNLTNIVKQAELINVKDKNGFSLLHWVVNNSQKCIVKELLDAGCNPKCSSLKGNTPLHIAASKSNMDIAEILLQSVTSKDLNDFVNAKTTEKGNTALHVAAKNNDLDMVKCLLKHGACYDIPNKEGETPVQLSSSRSVSDLLNVTRKLFSSFQEGDPDVATLLKSLGISNLLVVTKARNSEGLTLLQVAAGNKHRFSSREFAGLFQGMNLSERKQN